MFGVDGTNRQLDWPAGRWVGRRTAGLAGGWVHRRTCADIYRTLTVYVWVEKLWAEREQSGGRRGDTAGDQRGSRSDEAADDKSDRRPQLRWVPPRVASHRVASRHVASCSVTSRRAAFDARQSSIITDHRDAGHPSTPPPVRPPAR